MRQRLLLGSLSDAAMRRVNVVDVQQATAEGRPPGASDYAWRGRKGPTLLTSPVRIAVAAT